MERISCISFIYTELKKDMLSNQNKLEYKMDKLNDLIIRMNNINIKSGNGNKK